MSEFRVDQITNRDGSAGTQICGVSTFSGTSGMVMPGGSTEYRGGRGRGIMAGGSTPTNLNVMEFITIATTGNGTDFGDIRAQRAAPSVCSSSTRAIVAGGYHTTYHNTIDYVTISSGGGASTFGELVSPTGYGGACASSTRGIIAGGWNARGTNAGATSNKPYNNNIIEFVTIASTGDASYFGDLVAYRQTDGGLSSPTRGIFAGGATYGPPGGYPGYKDTQVIDYVTIASTGNAVQFGNLVNNVGWGMGKCSNSTRGLFASGYNNDPASYQSKISYITIATLGNTTEFGDTTDSRSYIAGMASPTRAVFAGGGPGPKNVIDYVEIATTGNAIDFGDMTAAKNQVQGTSDAHGGLG
tara:strand:- start:89 stop:1159 length:1071 start_codon:yes stop_codon:yes gene_type:complete